jgi:hypothetical protein
MVESHSENLGEALAKARRELKLLDPTWIASRAEVIYSYPQASFKVPLFGDGYLVAFHTGEVTREDGGHAGDGEALIILHYLVQADGTEVRDEWIAYRDLPGARYHDSAFIAEVERPLSLGLAGRLDGLLDWARIHGRILKLTGDLAFAWHVLPRVPLLVIFNEGDEEFPASARVLFDISAPNYLPTEDLSILAETAAERLLEDLGALEGLE